MSGSLDFGRVVLAAAAGVLMAAGLAGCAAQAPSSPAWSPTPAISEFGSAPQGAVIPPHMEVASWYGPGFQGHPTSTGERYDQYGLTAASTTLPLGSRVRVTNPANGRSVEVRVNDRGPYVPGRTIDLSRGAAERIGITGSGVAPVEVASPTAAPTPASLIRTTYAPPVRTAGWPERRPAEHRIAFLGSRHTYYHRSYRSYRSHRRSSRPRMMSDPIGAAIAGTLRMF
jgi:rare lipoprotein A